jgi:hypothetical protein
MFTWICPKCGREVPPSYTECPDCEKSEQASAAGPGGPVTPPEFVPPEAPHPAPPPLPAQPAAAPPQPFLGQVQVRPYQPPPPPPVRRRGLPAWLLTIVFAFAFLGVVAGVYWLVGYLHGASTKPAASVESPAAKPGATLNPYQKYIEVSGVRFLEGAKKKPEVRFVVTNHSPADIAGLAGNVTVWGRTRKSEEEAAGTFQFTTNLGPWESKDLSAPLTTKLELIELPDWQNISADVQITSPAQ